MKKIYLFLAFGIALFSAKAQNVASFEEQVLEPNSFWNGSDGSGGFTSGSFYFPNNYNADWGSWSGFSISNNKDSVTAGWGNQYSAIAAAGVNHSENYAVVYLAGEQKIEFENPQQISGFYVTNSTYAYLSMKNGDAYTKKFGGENGTDPDFFKLVASGNDIWGNETENIEFFLADFTSENNADDYLLKDWGWVDLSGLGVITNFKITLESTDMGAWGMNTPAYFCMDDFNGNSPGISMPVAEADFENVDLQSGNFYNGSDGAGSFQSGGFTFLNDYIAEWGSWSGFAASNITDNQTTGWNNQYSAIPGTGALGTQNYAVSYASFGSEILFEKTIVSGFYITNSTYSYWSMKNGDDYSKKFGGMDGSEPDWFKVTIRGISENGDTTGTIDYYLADFRAENDVDDYIIRNWEWVDLSSLGETTKLQFTLSSSDVGSWGMNTPAYFCIDQLNHQDLPPLILNPISNIENATYLDKVFYVSLDSVFTDPDNSDSEMILKVENIDNSELISGTIVKTGKPGELKTMLSLNIRENKTGNAKITVSATSNQKTVFHSFEMNVSVPVSTGNLTASEIKVYPNPFSQSFFIELPANAQKIVLYNQSGKIIFIKNTEAENKIQCADLKYSGPGIYFLKIVTDTENFTQKIVKL